MDDELTAERLALIEARLANVPLANDETMHYYIYYKEDVRLLMEVLRDLVPAAFVKE